VYLPECPLAQNGDVSAHRSGAKDDEHGMRRGVRARRRAGARRPDDAGTDVFPTGMRNVAHPTGVAMSEQGFSCKDESLGPVDLMPADDVDAPDQDDRWRKYGRIASTVDHHDLLAVVLRDTHVRREAPGEVWSPRRCSWV
jgi:hypothetical protein